jgi:hypothetical protein
MNEIKINQANDEINKAEKNQQRNNLINSVQKAIREEKEVVLNEKEKELLGEESTKLIQQYNQDLQRHKTEQVLNNPIINSPQSKFRTILAKIVLKI